MALSALSNTGRALDLRRKPVQVFIRIPTELFHLRKFSSTQELRIELMRYTRYYNHHRIKMKLNGLSPVQFRTQAMYP